jgi:hypothetical protein
MVLQGKPREQHLHILTGLTDVEVAIAADWLTHRYYRQCPQRTAHCPKCDGQLRTWRAKLCLHCGHYWHGEG